MTLKFCPAAPLPAHSVFYAAALVLVLAGCQNGPAPRTTHDRIDAELKAALADRPAPKVPERVSAALLPPLAQELPRPAAVPEQRFDLVVSNATVQQVYHAMASGSRYSILLPPTLSGTVSVNLKDVTMREALEVMREVHGFEYRIDGTRVYIQDASLQTRIFQVSYPSAKRAGRSDTRVISGSLTSNSSGSASGGSASGGNGAGASSASEGSQVSTTTDADFWKELDTALRAIVGTQGGRQVVMSQHTGTIVVRAMPKEQREIEEFLRSAKLAIERQVMLEAKIVEVSLKEGFESGINWSALKGGNHRFSVGADPSRINVPGSIGRAGGIEPGSIVTGVTPPTITPTTLGQLVASPFASGGAGMLGIAFTTAGFDGLLAFLETQGSVQVLSSPRVAAVNNQKAVLRVGTDDFYITNIATTTVASASGNVTTPTITLQPFFSGIALDVTPQIDEDGMVTMHVRPSVSAVSERSRIVNLGTLGNFTLPLASSNVNETDTVVRVQDGNIVAIGGLMQQRQSDDRSQVPGVGNVPVAGNLFKRTQSGLDKRELVFLIKPTVIKGDAQWREDIAATDARMQRLDSNAAP